MYYNKSSRHKTACLCLPIVAAAILLAGFLVTALTGSAVAIKLLIASAQTLVAILDSLSHFRSRASLRHSLDVQDNCKIEHRLSLSPNTRLPCKQRCVSPRASL